MSRIFDFQDISREQISRIPRFCQNGENKFSRKLVLAKISTKNQELMTPNLKSAPAPSVSTGAVIPKFSKRTSIREKALKNFSKSDKN